VPRNWTRGGRVISTTKLRVIATATVVAVATVLIPEHAVVATGPSRTSTASAGPVATVIAGYEGYCALLKSGGVECWGDNSYNELGDGTNGVASTVPVAVKGPGS
jgi:hypothetical protein